MVVDPGRDRQQHAHPRAGPRPGRLFVARRTHTFRQLAEAINDAFARWDRSHLYLFTLADGTDVAPVSWWDGADPDMIDDQATNLSRLQLGEQFAYTFDLGDNWEHLCTVAEQRIDPAEVYGIEPDRPAPYFGWGNIPDQYGRRWDGGDGQARPPAAPDPPLSDLPPILPYWGPQAR